MMLNMFYPGSQANTVFDIPYSHFLQKGIRGIIFDIDNTLVPHGEPANEAIKTLFSQLHEMGFQTCLLSNNRESRVQPFAMAVKSLYLSKAGKPSVNGYEKAMDFMETQASQTLFVGDQLFTDIYGANRAGIFSILVKPISRKEEIQIILKRFLEKPVLYFYHKSQKTDEKMSKDEKPS